MNVLLVDDDLVRRHLLRDHLLLHAGLEPDNICECSCVNELKRALQSTVYDVLVLDVVLPKRTGERPSAEHSLRLLSQLSRSVTLITPEKIVGITVHIEDIARFRETFEQQCTALIEARPNDSAWLDKVANAISLTRRSQLARTVRESELTVVTIHGIRTYGEWQSRFERIVKTNIPKVEVVAYKYGVFSALAFLIPALRPREAKRLCRHIRDLVDKDSARRYVFFCHSFGTILVTEAGRILESERTAARIPLIVFAGSPLPRNVDLSHLSRLGARVVNDCGDSDMVLLFSESLVLECGMAGRTGIVGFDGVHVLNRFFDASHSSYFCGDSFMTRHWLPLLSLDEPTKVDRRKPNVVRDELLEKLAIGIGTAKKLLWLLALIYLLVDAIRSW